MFGIVLFGLMRYVENYGDLMTFLYGAIT